jgi:hypothetical protein
MLPTAMTYKPRLTIAICLLSLGGIGLVFLMSKNLRRNPYSPLDEYQDM